MSLRPQTSRGAAILVAILLSLAFSAVAQLPKTSSTKADAKTEDPLANARTQFARGDLKGAETSVWTVLGSNPNQDQALTLLGQIRGLQQRYAEAEALFRRALQINPNSAPAHRGLGSALVAENQPDKAIEQFKSALDLAPADVALKIELARLYGSSGQFDQALTLLHSIPQNKFPLEAIPVQAATLLALGNDADLAALSEQAKRSPPVELELA